MKPTTRVFLGMFGAIGLLLSLPCFGLAIDQSTTEGTLIFLIMTAAILIPSIFTIYKAFASPKLSAAVVQQQENTERRILQTARAKNGRVSAIHIAANTLLTIEQATYALEQLEKRGLIYSEITNEGGIDFIFPDFLAPGFLKATTDFEEFDKRLAEENHIFDHDSAQQESHKTQAANQTTDRS